MTGLLHYQFICRRLIRTNMSRLQHHRCPSSEQVDYTIAAKSIEGSLIAVLSRHLSVSHLMNSYVRIPLLHIERSNSVMRFDDLLGLITFCVSRRRRKMYCGHPCLCLSVCLSVRGCMPTLLHGPGCKLG